jgi:histidyl-tRNA synthetase
MNAQMKRANGSGARFAAIIGESELQAGEVRVKSLATGEEEAVLADQVEHVVHG